ncbi:MAG: 1-deoxy-D-xylulose-5-phosphate synthase [Solirubrobacterales bacterium]
MPRLLDTIQNPSDLRKLNPSEMERLASEIRDVLVNTVAENGGHLAANLGVVELTLALHSVFNTPKDRIIWDVGHQSYVHKMITGRLEQMPTLRLYGGLSGFPKREESPYDAFDTGHSSTSISSAVGIALGRDLNQEDYKVLAVIGDGALTGGMAFEALNHAGHLGLDVTVVLNDNEMSISRNVGALSTYLSKLRSDPAYTRRKEIVEQMLLGIPAIGENLLSIAGKLKDGVKYLMVPGKFFEELGFTYIGPIDGHKIDDMIDVFSKAKRLKGPVLLHVVTRKGKGYAPAYNHPDTFHGIGPFDIVTGVPVKRKTKGMTYTQVFGDYLVRKAAATPKLTAITAAMTSGTGLVDFAEQYPERFYDVGICEQHAVTMAAGLAVTGAKPVVAIYSTFLQRAYDQIVHDVCLQGLPVVFAVDRAGLVGDDGPTHHGVFDISYLRQIPNLIVMAPSDEDELVDMMDSALQYGRPVALRYPRGNGEGAVLKEKPAYVEIGTGTVLKEGERVCLVALGRMVPIAMKAARLLQEQGISAAVINARFAKPLDTKLLTTWARRTGRIVTLEENVLAGGFGSAVAEELGLLEPRAEVLRIGIPDRFIEQGTIPQLFEDLGLDAPGIAGTILKRWSDLRIVKTAAFKP